MRTVMTAGLALALLGASASAQDRPELQGRNSTTLYGNVGYSWNVSTFAPSSPGLEPSGPAANVRIMWRSKYLISYGVEVGYTTRFTVNNTTDSSSIRATSGAVPMMAVVSMSPARRLFVNAGLGWVFSTNTVTALGSSASSSAFGSGLMLGAAYYWPVSNKFDFGADFRFFRANTYDDNLFSLQFSVAYRLRGQ